MVCMSVPSYLRQFRMYRADILLTCPGAHGGGSYMTNIEGTNVSRIVKRQTSTDICGAMILLPKLDWVVQGVKSTCLFSRGTPSNWASIYIYIYTYIHTYIRFINCT